MVVSVAPCRRDGSYLWLPLILVGKQTCLQTKKKEKCRLLCFFKPVCLGFCFVVQVLQFWGRKVCLFSLCVYVCGFASFKKIVCGFLNVASFFFVLLSSQHVNHIAYWAECKPLSQKEKLHRPKPQISVVYRTSKSVSVWPPQFVLKRLSPAFRCTCVIDRFLASQRLEMVMDDQSGRRSPPRPQATVHSNRPNTSTHTHIHPPVWTLSCRGDTTLWCTVEHLAVVITQMLASVSNILPLLSSHSLIMFILGWIISYWTYVNIKGYFFIV